MNRSTTNNLSLKDFKGNSNEAFGILYSSYFVYTKRFVLNNSGSVQDAEDIFQDALIVLYEKLCADNFQVYTCLENYVTGIAKNLWLKKLRKQFNTEEISDNYYAENSEEIDLAIENERNYADKLADFISKISLHCQNLIEDIFMKNKSIEDIQSKYKYSTTKNAQNQKYKCVEQIRRVKENTNIYT